MKTQSEKYSNPSQWLATGRPNYQQKNGWRLQPHQIETPKGVSETVPDDSYAIKDLIKKFAGGLDPSVTKLANFNGEENEVDFDDVDMAAASRADYHEVDELQREVAARQKLLLEQMEARKKEALEAQKSAEKKARSEERNEGQKEAQKKAQKEPQKSDSEMD